MKFYFSSDEYLRKEFDEEISHNDFNEIKNSVFILLQKSINYNENLILFINSISEAISIQIFELIKFPILYTYNSLSDTYKDGRKNILFIRKKELFYSCFSKYPQLKRILDISIQNYVKYFSDLIDRFLNDKKDIQNYFGIDSVPISIQWPIGDFHNNGQTHTVIIFQSGSKIAYKVKPYESSLVFECIIRKINEKGYNLPFIFPKRLIKCNYYWEEFVNYVPNNSKKGVKLYYENIGKYLALFYSLGISDIIADNIIVKKTIPVFIDTECLFKPIIKSSINDTYPLIENYYKESVIGTGLLPFWTPNKIDNVGLNFGGISLEAIHSSHTKLFFSRNKKIEYLIQSFPKYSYHIPSKSDKKIAIDVMCSKICDGFDSCCRFIMINKKWLISIVKSLINQYNISTRVLMRHTNVYNIILKESLHPDNLKSYSKRIKILNYLYSSYDKDCFPKELIESEIKELQNLDYPIFYTKPFKKFIFDKNNRYYILKKSGFHSMVNRINKLSDTVIKDQISYIEKSISCFYQFEQSKDNKILEKKSLNNNSLPYNYDTKKIKKHIIQIAEKVLNDRIRVGKSYQWIDINVGRVGQWEFAPKNFGIYDGLDGLGLFYLYLYKFTKESKYKRVAQSIMNKSLFTFKNFNPSKSYYLFSPYHFPFSTLYFYWHYSKIIGDIENTNLNELFEQKLVPYVKNNIRFDTFIDVLNGCSGLLILLIDYYKNEKLNSLILPIQKIYQKILKSAIITSNGITWECNKFKYLVGFAHGNAGILYALSKYYELFGYTKKDIMFLNSIIKYNNNYFFESYQGWRDLRYSDFLITSPSWCHGSSGILNAYLEIENLLPINFDINWNKIKGTILKEGFEHSHCLCHGMLGNLETLMAIGYKTKNHNLITLTKNKIVFEIYKKDTTGELNWKTGFKNGKFSLNGLFLGNSGIAYNILKLLFDYNMPSILLLHPPTSNKPRDYKSL